MRRQSNPTQRSRRPCRRVLLGLLAALTLAVPARAARTVPVQIDGTELAAVCHLESGVTYVPLRALLNTLGGWELEWDSRQRAAVAVSGSSRLTASPAAGTVTVDGAARPGKVYVQEGVTYVPLRTTAELLGGTVEWDAYFQGAAVTSAGAEYNAVDFYWLSRIISAESRGEPLEGQIAVGNVVLAAQGVAEGMDGGGAGSRNCHARVEAGQEHGVLGVHGLRVVAGLFNIV